MPAVASTPRRHCPYDNGPYSEILCSHRCCFPEAREIINRVLKNTSHPCLSLMFLAEEVKENLVASAHSRKINGGHTNVNLARIAAAY
ncbi:hypothetical protein E2C01_090110 [Portunus trituberculatus]|uniref:Uncharacterized protein n=1 Tax=Portunus trituberculatus TaxID=210409 RepID=A0A5B7JJD3_PORTR|nr:hypothetical protein [Portunus trituberculatus]